MTLILNAQFNYEYKHEDGLGNRSKILLPIHCNNFCDCPKDKSGRLKEDNRKLKNTKLKKLL